MGISFKKYFIIYIHTSHICLLLITYMLLYNVITLLYSLFHYTSFTTSVFEIINILIYFNN